MIYLGVGAGSHNHKSICMPNNVIFTAAQALFDEHMFPKCPHDQKRQKQDIASEESEQEKPAYQVPTPSILPDDDDKPQHPPI